MFSRISGIWHILLVCFLDMLSYAMLSPVIVLLFVEGQYRILPPKVSYGYLLLGLFLSTYSSVQVFSVPLWGRLSIAITKRRVLLLSLLGAAVGYGICAYGIYLKQVWLLFTGSFVAGLTGANMSTIQALISQESEPKHWEQNFSLVGSLIGVAFIIGPQITSALMVVFPSYSLGWGVFLVCAFCSLINWLIVYFFVEETGKKPSFAPVGISSDKGGLSLKNFANVPRNVQQYLLYLFCIYFAWFFFIKFFQVYLLETLRLPEQYCCLGSSYLGLCCALWQSWRYFFNPSFLKNPTIINISSAIMGMSLFSFLFITTFWQAVIVTIFLSFSYSIIIPTMISKMFRSRGGHNDYKASLNQSVQSLAKVISPILSGALLSFSFTWPVLLSCLSMFCAFSVAMSFDREPVRVKVKVTV